MPRSHLPVLSSALLFTTGLCAQEAPAPGVRQRLDAIFRGSAPLPERLEWNGAIIETAELGRQSDGLQGDRALHCQELLILRALTEELQRNKQMLSDDVLAEAYEQYRKPYDETPFTVKVIATKYKGYPSLEAFLQRWRLMHAFGRTINPDRKVLEQCAEAERAWLSGDQVTVELWFYRASDDGKGGWDFAAAEERARKGLADLRGGKDREEVRKDSDPIPMPANVPADAAGKPLHYNVLRGILGESEYTDLVLGADVADTVFRRARPAELTGPLRGVRGCWLARVGERLPSKRVFELKDERTETTVRQVYVERCFREWAARVLAKSVLRVPAK